MRSSRGLGCWVFVVPLVAAACAGDSPPSEQRLAINERASIGVPLGWAATAVPGGLVLAPQAGGADRIDVAAVQRREYSLDRDVSTTLAAVKTQAAAAAEAQVGEAQFIQFEDRPAGSLDWTYTVDGAPRSRRHWVVELHNTTVHVSCIGASAVPEDACLSVVTSLEESPTSLGQVRVGPEVRR